MPPVRSVRPLLALALRAGCGCAAGAGRAGAALCAWASPTGPAASGAIRASSSPTPIPAWPRWPTAAQGLTADGEAFDQGALAAAHRTLQLPALARVTNLENGRAVLVRINDRGPDIRAG